MNRGLVAILVLLLCIVVAMGLSDPRIFAAMPESIFGIGVSVAWFLVLFLILAGLWRLVNRVVSGESAAIYPRTAPDAGQRFRPVRRLNGWQRIGIVLTVCWVVGITCVVPFLLVNDKYPPSTVVIVGIFAAWLIIPPVVGWLLAYLGVIAVRWIRAGFRTGDT